MLVPAAAFGVPLDSIIVTDASLSGDHVVWSPDSANFYLLTELVFVENGDTLEILPGTVIKGEPGQGDSASALIVARGGHIICDGTQNAPIIFTCQADDPADPFDLPLSFKGQWGGLVLLGVAGTNRAGDSGNIEGIPVTESRAIYGPGSSFALNDADNSGIVRYTSLRYGGSVIGLNNEINGLTMGAVGSGTTIEYVEVFNNADDGFEWFGGTVNSKHLVSAYNDDDGFDYDEGWRGNNQFWLVYMDNADGNTGGEHDGGTTPEDGLPYAIPVISNATWIGTGPLGGAFNDMALNFRDNAGGKYYNSIFADFFGFGAQIEDLVSGQDSRQRLDDGEIEFQRNIWYSFGSGDAPVQLFPQTWTEAHMTSPANANVFGVNPKLASWPSDDRSNDGGFNPTPRANGPAAGGGQAPADPYFDAVTYKGAFDPAAPNWLLGWTALDQLGFLGDANFCAILIDGDLNGSLTVTSSDIITLVNYVFKGGADPEPCAANGDVNCSGAVSSADVITLVNFVFKAGAPPCDICNSPTAQACN
jgi:hypothetical protein